MLKKLCASAILRYLIHSPIQRGKIRLARIVDPLLRGVPIKSSLGPVMSARLTDTTFWLCMGKYQSFVRQVVDPLRPGDIFIDVGANMGMFSLAAAERVGPTGLVFAFEPSVREFNELVQNINLNEASNVLPFRLALAEKMEVTEMSIAMEIISGHNRLGRINTDGNSYKLEKVFTTDFDCLQLTKYFGPTQKVYIKIDTEGHEFAVLSGMNDLLTNHNVVTITAELAPGLLEQFGHSLLDVVNLLSNKGFLPNCVVNENHADYTFQKQSA